MRVSLLLAGLLVLTPLVALAPTAEARELYCTELRGNCPGFVCADFDLDGRVQSDECIDRACPGGCCGPRHCPPPDWE